MEVGDVASKLAMINPNLFRKNLSTMDMSTCIIVTKQNLHNVDKTMTTILPIDQRCTKDFSARSVHTLRLFVVQAWEKWPDLEPRWKNIVEDWAEMLHQINMYLILRVHEK